ncbi:MAG TPA: 2,3-bisphosphoglycerate-independent phosphoglycerate mutase, partial [Anaerolineales bacterium]|nr:2,3-bisphosphoglycerate-independent phosphoglycerate mutase [Anaerolineales bacterium]
AEGVLGQTVPIKPGITPGSGPAHLALFGYDPLEFIIGRGVLSALGLGIPVSVNDVAARGNFCTIDSNGIVTDRRAGRISSEEAAPLVDLLGRITIEGFRTEVLLEREYRFTLVLHGPNLHPAVLDTDPQITGLTPLPAVASNPAAEFTAALVNRWIAEALKILQGQPKANGVLLRGFGNGPDLESYKEAYGLRAACVAVYPMYRGVSRLVGMDILEFPGETPLDEFSAVARNWENYDFFFVHIKKTDSKGEDGDFKGKAEVIEEVDRALTALVDLQPDVLMVTGDHSTPSSMRTHSWHPVPFLLWAPRTARPDLETAFGERNCARGGLGTFPATDTMPLALAHALRLDKFGA